MCPGVCVGMSENLEGLQRSMSSPLLMLFATKCSKVFLGGNFFSIIELIVSSQRLNKILLDIFRTK